MQLEGKNIYQFMMTEEAKDILQLGLDSFKSPKERLIIRGYVITSMKKYGKKLQK